jgi:hypothetical protein
MPHVLWQTRESITERWVCDGGQNSALYQFGGRQPNHADIEESTRREG